MFSIFVNVKNAYIFDHCLHVFTVGAREVCSGEDIYRQTG